ncbi:MAG: helix-turn-helix domain-containing protein [Pseudomonadota bacterium]
MDTNSNRKAAHNRKVRARILDAAAEEIRSRGLAGASIDCIMAAADLTRGAFYAHFASKGALFEAVLREAHPLLKRLCALPDNDAEALRSLFADYLAPEHLAQVSRGCTLAALASDAGRASENHKLALGDAREKMLSEMLRASGGKVAPDRLDAALTLSTGAVLTAQADANPRRQRATLEAALTGFHALMR